MPLLLGRRRESAQLWERAPGQFEFLLIETLGHQIPAANVDHISVGIFTTVVRARQGCIQLRIECAQVNTSPRSNRRITAQTGKTESAVRLAKTRASAATRLPSLR